MEVFEKHENMIFTFICSTEELDTNHPDILPQEFRWALFDALYHHQADTSKINIQDAVVGPTGYQSLGRVFYRDIHSPIIHVIADYLQEKQQQYL